MSLIIPININIIIIIIIIQSVSGEAEIAVTEGVTTITASVLFFYDPALTPIITSMAETTALVSGN